LEWERQGTEIKTSNGYQYSQGFPMASEDQNRERSMILIATYYAFNYTSKTVSSEQEAADSASHEILSFDPETTDESTNPLQ
jgi:hypothetical protein